MLAWARGLCFVLPAGEAALRERKVKARTAKLAAKWLAFADL